MAISDQRHRRPGADALGARNARILVVSDFGRPSGCGGCYPARPAGARHADADDRGRCLFPRRRGCDDYVCARASPRIVTALVMAVGRRSHGRPDRLYHHRGTAGFGALGDRIVGWNQSPVWRSVSYRNGAGRSQRLILPVRCRPFPRPSQARYGQQRAAELAAAADAFDLLVERGILAVGGAVWIAQVLLSRHLVGTRLSVTNWRRPRALFVG